MAILIRGKTICRLCHKVIAEGVVPSIARVALAADGARSTASSPDESRGELRSVAYDIALDALKA